MVNLKNRLISYMKEDWQFPSDIDTDILADEMKSALANKDGILRDRLVLVGFDKLILSGSVSDKKCRDIFDDLVCDKFLLNGLGKECDDSVFGRAFSGYGILTLLEYNDNKVKKIFTNEDVLTAFQAILKCFIYEKDLRGFVDGKGWAHSIAHNADCLATLTSYDILGYNELTAVLYAVKERVYQGHSAIISDYDRLSQPVLNVIERGIITEQELIDWITDISTYKITGCQDEDVRNIMSRCEFLIFLRFKINDKHPYLNNHVSSKIIELMEL